MGLQILTIRMYCANDSADLLAKAALEKAKEIGVSVELVEVNHVDNQNVVYKV